ncbi:MAG: sugar transferase [Clostridia bacterium]|nr:sugar transferase [Clostridia bacterium]
MGRKSYLIIKRAVDLLLSAVLLLVLSPLLIALSVWVKLDSPGKVFFRQKRVGKGKKYFQIYKFRSMRSDAPKDVPTHLMTGADRLITRSGRVLRKTSLDELPQLINILQGDMSFVGPRPALWNQYDLIEERDKYGANDVTPGLTGLAQVSGRDELSIEDKAAKDGEYVRRMSLGEDIGILFRTVASVIRHKGYKDNE